MSNALATTTPEFRGDKYDASLSVVEIARRLRLDIKTAIATGLLPTGLVVSVTSSTFSMGRAVRVAVKCFPGPALNPASVYADELPCFERPCRALYSPKLTAVVQALEEMLAAYNRDASDSQSDHWDVSFYGSVNVRVDSTAERAALLASDAFHSLNAAKVAHVDLSPLLDAFDISRNTP